jgi:SAM-dependent methyltransferase
MKSPHSGSDDFRGNIERFSGFADLYDRVRPSPPEALAPLLSQFGGWPTLALVVDLGSGTGLSTRYWTGKAERVIGIEPSVDMRTQAAAATADANVSYHDGLAHTTALPSGCAMLVSCSQSLHWMAPQPTFEEARRILVAGGVFAACDYDWPPATGSWVADGAFDDCLATIRGLERELKLSDRLQQWDKSGHLARMKTSGCFRYVREALLHHSDLGNAERLVGLLLSQGSTVELLKAGLTESQLGIDTLRQAAASALGAAPRLWLWSARVRMAVV